MPFIMVPGVLGLFTPAPAAGVTPPSGLPPQGARSVPGPANVPGPVGAGQSSPPTDGTPGASRIEFVSPAPDTLFLIDATPTMPKIETEIRLVGITVNPLMRIRVTWTVAMRFDEVQMAFYGKRGVVFTDEFEVQNNGLTFTPTFPLLGGGQLTLTARTQVDNATFSASLSVWVMGTDPGWAAISPLLANDTMRRIARHESGGKQFETDRGSGRAGIPVLNRGHDGGGGVCQITPPTRDDLWNWKTNIASGKRVFGEKQAAAAGHRNEVAKSPEFRNLVNRLNANRAAAGLPALTVTVPTYTAEQLRDDTIRRYNGGTEFRLARVNGELQLANVDEQARTATAVWERIPVAERHGPGDHDYVQHILNQSIQ
jgi:hypothetical protein